MKTFKKIDIAIIAIVLIITLSLLLIKNSKNNYGNFVVKVNGKVYTILEKPGVYPIKDGQGNTLTNVHFDGNQVWVTNSSCPLKICEKTGKIDKGGKIICVPNKIVIEAETTELQTW